MKASRLFASSALALLLALAVLAPAPAQDPPKGTEAPPAGSEAPPAGTEAPPAGSEAPPPAGEPKRELDTTSPEAIALKELLHVDPRYCKDGTVELIYNFSEEAQLADWQNLGFDRCDSRGELTLGVGSQGAGLLSHCLELKGDFEVTFVCRLDWVTSRSDLVFFIGKGGGRYGNAFVQKSGNGFRPVGKVEPARDRFGAGRTVTIKYVKKGQELTVHMNGVNLGTTKKLGDKLDGKVSIFMTDMRLILQSCEIRGHIDTSKL